MAASCELKSSGNSQPSFPAMLLPKLMADVPGFVGRAAAEAIFHSAGELFDMDYFATVTLRELGCLVTDWPTWQRMVATGEVHLVEGFSTEVKSPRVAKLLDRGRILDILYKAMMPSQRLQDLSLRRCQESLKEKMGSYLYLTIHMRVEDDWVENCRPFTGNKKKRKGKKRFARGECTATYPVTGKRVFNALMISKVVRSTPELNAFKRIFMIYAADRVNTLKTRKMFGMQPDPMSVWPEGTTVTHPQQLNCFEGTNATYTERSVVNFFMAGMTEGPFIGTPRSTFSMGEFLFRRWRQATSYLYDCSSGSKMLVPFSQTCQKNPAWIPTTRPIRC